MGQGMLLWACKRNGSDSLKEMTKPVCTELARCGSWLRLLPIASEPDSLRGTGAWCVSWGPSQTTALLRPGENQQLNLTCSFLSLSDAWEVLGSSCFLSIHTLLPKVSPIEMSYATLQSKPDSGSPAHTCSLSPPQPPNKSTLLTRI